MSGKKKSSNPKMPTAKQLQPLLALQRQYSQVGVETPFGGQSYRTNPDGTQTLVTSLSPQGQGLVDRSMQLGMTDSDQVYVPGQVNAIAGALGNRVAGRFGVPSSQMGMQLGPSKPPSPQAMPQAASLPPLQQGPGG